MSDRPEPSRSPKRRWRTAFFASLPIIVLIVVLVMIANWRRNALATQQDAPPPAAAQIAILPDGIVMFAPNGSVAQHLVDWLDAAQKGSRYFEVGGTQFVGKDVEPTAVAKTRLKKLVDIMGAYPRVKVTVIGFTGRKGGSQENGILSEQRAKRVVELLVADGVSADRLAARGRGEMQNIDPENSQANERVGLLLEYE